MEPDPRDEECQEEEWSPSPDDVLLAVQDRLKVAGVDKPGALRGKENPRPHTSDWRAPPRSPENTYGVKAEQMVGTMEEILTIDYQTEAMVVPYILLDAQGRPSRWQPRINKGGVAWLASLGYTVRFRALMIDIDNPKGPNGKKIPWTQAMIEDVLEKLALPWLASADYYFTRNGLRIVQRLTTWVTPEHYEQLLQKLWYELRQIGLLPDEKCSDWTHVYRPPKHRRPDDPVNKKADPEPMLRGWPIEPAPFVDVGPAPSDDLSLPTADGAPRPPRASAPARPRKGRRLQGAITIELPPHLEALVPLLAEGVADEGDRKGGYHDMLLALSGMLASARGIELNHVPAIIHAVATRALDGAISHYEGAVDSVNRAMGEGALRGSRYLRKHYPKLHAAAKVAIAQGRAAAIAAARQPVARRPTADVAASLILEKMTYAMRGLTVISTSPGTGKSAQARHYAVERARLGGRLPSGRWAPHTKTSISVPTHALAKEYVDTLRATYPDVPVRRLVGPASVRDAEGKLVCKFAAQAQLVAGAGMSVRYELCEGRNKNRCPHADTCPAYTDGDGPEDAPIVVGVHPYLAQLDKEAGKTGVLIVDEPPEPVTTVTFKVDDLRFALGWSGFENRYGYAMRPAVLALLAHIDGRADDGAGADGIALTDAIALGQDGVSDLDFRNAVNATGQSWDAVLQEIEAEPQAKGQIIRRSAGMAFSDDVRAPAPVKRHIMAQARSNLILMNEVARAAGPVDYIRRVCEFPDVDPLRPWWRMPRMWLETRDGVRSIVCKQVNRMYAEALTRDGTCLVLDAHAHVQLKPIEKIIGAKPELVDLEACDNAPIERHIHVVKGTRTEWFVDGYPVWSKIARALQAVQAWLTEDSATQTFGLITFAVVERAILAIQGNDKPWHKAGHSMAQLQLARAELAGVVQAFTAGQARLVVTGHYGAIRGLNSFHTSDLDALVTLGDPFPNVGDKDRDEIFLDLEDEVDYVELVAAAELGQAQERLRTCRRTRRARALHVGMVLPATAAWREIDLGVTEDLGGRSTDEASPRNGKMRDAVCAKRISPTSLAVVLEVPLYTVDHWLAGDVKLRDDKLDLLEKMMADTFAINAEKA